MNALERQAHQTLVGAMNEPACMREQHIRNACWNDPEQMELALDWLGRVSVCHTLVSVNTPESMMGLLNRAEQLILILYYYEFMTLGEIGITLDLAEEEITRMHDSILSRLMPVHPVEDTGDSGNFPTA